MFHSVTPLLAEGEGGQPVVASAMRTEAGRLCSIDRSLGQFATCSTLPQLAPPWSTCPSRRSTTGTSAAASFALSYSLLDLLNNHQDWTASSHGTPLAFLFNKDAKVQPK